LNGEEKDSQVEENRGKEISQRQDRMTEIEREISIYNDKLLDVIEESDEKEDNNNGNG
jgi:hypothetical protein